jgi:uncharacterized integral membrane protein
MCASVQVRRGAWVAVLLGLILCILLIIFGAIRPAMT